MKYLYTLTGALAGWAAVALALIFAGLTAHLAWHLTSYGWHLL